MGGGLPILASLLGLIVADDLTDALLEPEVGLLVGLLVPRDPADVASQLP